MKLTALPTPFEAIPPKCWEGFRNMVHDAARTWGLAVEIEEGPAVTAAIANFWRMSRIHDDAQRLEPTKED